MSLGDEEQQDQRVVGNEGKADLDAVLAHQGDRVPTFDHGDVEKENVFAGNDEELLDMVAEMPLHSQHPDLDDEMDALLELEEDVYMGDFGDVEEEDDTVLGMVPEERVEEKSTAKEEQHAPECDDGGGRQGIIKDREMLPPQRDALNATEEYVMVTATGSGERVYAPMYRNDEEETGGCLKQSLRRGKGSLLSTRIEDLLAIVEREHFERALQATKASKRAKKASKQVQEQGRLANQHGLWVDKYAPQGFMDLLSDEKINRDVVKWMKMWDHCVFGKSIDSKEQSTDAYKRPDQKIVLLAGPPGLGKTTLAHIVARHCGYKVMEINASDERNGPALMSKVANAMEMASVIGEKRPNCIIIDEIDGAAGGPEGRSAISALVKLANAKPHVGKNTSDAVDDDGGDAHEVTKKRQGRKNVEKPLTRPIICICNDLYAPVLRPLRDVAKVFMVRPPGAEKLVERLGVIAKKEKLKTDKMTLRGLVERTECDIRSCLNTMQFIAKKQKSMKMTDISSVGAGQKDVTMGVFRLWKDLLHLKKGPSIIGKVAETESQRCLRQYNALADFADQDLVLGGLFESLPSIILFDMALMRTSTVLENMITADILQSRISRNAEFSLMAYLPAYTLRVGHILSGPENPSVNWPRRLQSSKRDFNEKKAILHKWRIGMGPDSYITTGKNSAVLDVIPFVPWVTTPNLRPVSRHLYSNEEKKSLERLVDAMIGLGITYSLEESDNTQHQTVEFIPSLHTFWDFSLASCLTSEQITRPREISIPIRQMVVHELDMEKIKRNARSHGAPQHATTPSTKGPPTKAVPITLAQRLEENKVSSKQSVGKKVIRKRNWLDDIRSKETTRVSNPGVTNKKHRAEDMAVLYKFHEGYTNAVKKPVKISQL